VNHDGQRVSVELAIAKDRFEVEKVKSEIENSKGYKGLVDTIAVGCDIEQKSLKGEGIDGPADLTLVFSKARWKRILTPTPVMSGSPKVLMQTVELLDISGDRKEN
jgi:hypothetical protein